MNPEPLYARSLTEIQFYLRVTPCSGCGRGPLKPVTDHLPPASSPFSLTAKCGGCHQQAAFTFTLPEHATPTDRDDLYPVINPTPEPSRIIDVGQWIVLFRLILETAGKETDKIEARRLGYEAAQCLAEAVKFYEDNDLPPESAIFCESTRVRRRDNPQQFSKQNLMDIGSKLPKLTTMQRQITRCARRKDPDKRPWWRFWQA